MAALYLKVFEVMDGNRRWTRVDGRCEPQLSKRGLYPSLGSQRDTRLAVDRTMWALNLADGSMDTVAMAERAGCAAWDMQAVIEPLVKAGLLVAESRPDNRLEALPASRLG